MQGERLGQELPHVSCFQGERFNNEKLSLFIV